MYQETKYDTIFDAQKHFRILMNCMARPGLSGKLISDIFPPSEFNKASALTAFALLNSDVTFSVKGLGDNVESYIKANTGSSVIDIKEADFLFISGNLNGNFLNDVKVGTLQYPEIGATVIIDAQKISNEPVHSLCLQLSGPGIESTVNCSVEGLDSTLLDACREKNKEYPLGIDIIITDSYDNVICLPRTTKLTWSE